LPDGKLGELVDLISTIGFGESAATARDVLGQVYEYFLGMFASAEGKRGGQFYTPAASSRRWWPCWPRTTARCTTRAAAAAACSCRARSSSKPRRQAGRRGHLRPGGQPHHLAAGRDEPGHSRHRLQPGPRAGRHLHPQPAPDLRADFILANPPFNISDWWHGSLSGDPRWEYGDPPQGNANYAWLQHMLWHLKPTAAPASCWPTAA
jgi:type I restriction enzyme M protein